MVVEDYVADEAVTIRVEFLDPPRGTSHGSSGSGST